MSTEINWQKSSFSEGGAQCVEVAGHSDNIAIRESDDPNVIASTSRSKFSAFIASVKTGEFDHLTD
ncbi:DUF397 domain-containing protein [Streptomyces sp. NPDC088258]|uniref:DUF397 domain-containing protein n=1 Tax=Streptomyces sp. NPDC088258 TaxID=3365849 RepID=UPI0037F39AF9